MADHSPRRPPLGVIIAIIAVVLSAGSATAWFTWRAIAPQAPQAEFPEIDIDGDALPEGFESPDSESITVPDPPESEVATEPPRRQSTIYWVSMQDQAVALSPANISLPEGESPADTLSLAFNNLMTGPSSTHSDTATSIPDQTELLALTVESDGVHVNLSDEFTRGGGSASMIGRLAQVVYTATTLDPDAPVWISVEGEPLTLLGGEGLIIRQPMTRNDLQQDFGVKAPAG